MRTISYGTVLFFFLLCAVHSTAQQKKFSGWGMTMNNFVLSPKFNLVFDSQLRSGDNWKQPETFIFRPGLTYVLNKHVSLTAGLALITNWKTVEGIRDEVSDNRIWQQLNIVHNGKNSSWLHRLRMEERWIPTLKTVGNQIAKTEPKFNARFRYFARHIHFLSNNVKVQKGLYLVAQNEFFFNAVGAVNANKKLFDQSRTYAGTGYRLGKHADLELGYMFVFVEGRNKDYTNNNIIQVSSFLRL